MIDDEKEDDAVARILDRAIRLGGQAAIRTRHREHRRRPLVVMTLASFAELARQP